MFVFVVYEEAFLSKAKSTQQKLRKLNQNYEGMVLQVIIYLPRHFLKINYISNFFTLVLNCT